ncbi:MAG: CHAD domain-containing protein, partial [Gammaproteobacteria bacterium]|nr:CHAD domain-containing protein [Gammaproteobacteria bacterium]
MREAEAKYLVRRADDIAAVLQKIVPSGGRLRERGAATHTDTYYDTGDWAIYRSGWVCRCREHNGGRKLMLKSFGTQNSCVFVREELEQPLPDGIDPGRHALPAGPVRERLETLVGRRRRHALFTVRTLRSVFELGLPGGQQFELDVDHVTVGMTKGKQSSPRELSYVELEIELKEGRVRDLRKLSRRLDGMPGVVPARLSKFDRGLRAAGLSVVADDDAALTPPGSGRQSFPDLVHAYLARRVASLERNVPVAWEGLDPEGVHKMRVSIRRIRAILAALSDLFTGPRYAGLDAELRWLGRQLGGPRDADICARHAESCIAALPAAAAAAAAPYANFL